MTTCTNMQELIQAYVDGQLSTEDRIFVEKHVSECPECAHSFQEMRDLTSYLVDTFAAARISTTFVDRVSARLPDIYDEASTKEIRELNKLAKQEGWFYRANKFVPYAATAILGVALVILMAVWPHEPLGFVAKVTNSAQLLRSDPNTTGPSTISIGDTVLPGDTVLVGNGSRLIVALKTAEIKLNSGSMLRFTGGREVELVKGELYADVDKANQPFRIKLNSGTITVLGTKFLVQVLEDKTVVTVARGNVLFKNPTGYSEVRAGTQSVSFAGGTPTEPQEIEVPEVTRWADEFVVTKEDKALARMRGASLPEERYRDVPLSRGEPIQTKSWLFDTRSRGSDRSEIRYVSINRNAFGTDPRLPVDNNFAIYICDPAMKPLGRAKGSYSLFDGTDSVAVLRLTNPVSVQGMFLVIFQPFAGSDLATGKSQRTLYSGLQGISPKIVIEPLENMPAMEGINVS